MSSLDLFAATWVRSSYSTSAGGECVEVAFSLPGTVPVRDSKDPQGAVLRFSPSPWTAFVGGLRRGDGPVPDQEGRCR
jgi:hypothetical protein